MRYQVYRFPCDPDHVNSLPSASNYWIVAWTYAVWYRLIQWPEVRIIDRDTGKHYVY